jgi:hypothetical protein
MWNDEFSDGPSSTTQTRMCWPGSTLIGACWYWLT